MRTVRFRSIAFAIALVVPAATAIAREQSSAVLNTLEVRQLVARGEPADNARLSAHFSALADGYAVEAKRHDLMSKSSVGNPSRNIGTGMSVHCKRLADLNRQEEATLRELAAYHDKLAGGIPAALPDNTARYQSGAGAPAPTDAELAALAAKAGTPAEHHALEEYFRTLAGRYAASAKEHAAFAAGVRSTRIEHTAAMHDRLALLARDAAKEATAAADMHRQFANVGR
jgi:hypothetical protein